MSAPEFLAVSFAGASLWVVLVFFLIHSAQRSSRNLLLFSIASIVASIAAAQTVRALLPHFQRILRRVKRWEFWPAWLFYIPVAFIYTCLALRFRGFTLPAAANPGQLNGGIIGESKAEILRELQVVAPNHVARSFLLSGAERNARINLLLANQQLEFPFVLKPDLGQRGAGFRIIRNSTDLDAYLASVPSDLIAQQYAAGPGEAGIFYYRLPDEPGGHILAITDKIFPAVRGDGRRTLRELIKSDERASFIADTYLSRLSSRANEIVNAGETVRLVEAGNHCQGCIFADGARLNSNSLLDTIDRISQSLSGFYIGRYDVRYATEEDLRAGRFTIIELNGAASEVTSIYDAGHSLASAYRMLYRQWHLVFAIAHVNRRRGFRPASPMQLLRCWREYCRISAAYPGAD